MRGALRLLLKECANSISADDQEEKLEQAIAPQRWKMKWQIIKGARPQFGIWDMALLLKRFSKVATYINGTLWWYQIPQNKWIILVWNTPARDILKRIQVQTARLKKEHKQ